MSSILHGFKWREAGIRILSDFLLVHLSMVGALTTSVMYRTAIGSGVEAQQLISDFTGYYRHFFLLLSPIFPLVFLLNGFYTRSRAYVGRHKNWIIFRGVSIAVLIFFAVNTFVWGATNVGRSVSVPFLVLASFSLAAVRVLKALGEKHFSVRRRSSPAASEPRKRVLIVGGAGYIGSLLVERLLQKGFSVRVLDMLIYGDEPLRRAVGDNPHCELMIGDCRNIRDVVKAVQGVDSIVHLAAIVGDPACEQDRNSALEINYAATRMLIEIAKGHGVNRMIFASSCSVYGATDIEMDEESATVPISLYAHTKVDSESALLEARTETFHPTVLRYATVFGLGHRPRFDLVVNLLTARAQREKTITIFNGQQWRPFIHVRDVVEATLRVLEAPATIVSGQTFNVGDSRLNHTLSDVAHLIKSVFPDTQIESVDNSDKRNYRVNFSKIRSRLGFQARYTLLDGIEELKRALDAGEIDDYRDVRFHNQRFLEAVGVLEHKTGFDGLVMAAFSTPPGLTTPVAEFRPKKSAIAASV